MKLDIKLVNRDPAGELILSGRIDSTNADDVSELFTKVAARFQDIVLNMKDLKFISSAGLRSLMKLYREMRSKGGTLTLTNLAPYVAEVLEMTGFSEMFDIK